jgi:hypothetical protein
LVTNFSIFFRGFNGVSRVLFGPQKEKNTECVACSGQILRYDVSGDTTLDALLSKLKADPKLKFVAPSVSGPNGPLFLTSKFVIDSYRPNLEKPLKELFVRLHYFFYFSR